MAKNLKFDKILDLLFERSEAKAIAHELITTIFERQLEGRLYTTRDVTDRVRNIYNTLIHKEFLVKEGKEIYVSASFVLNLLHELLTFTGLHSKKRIVSSKCPKCGKKNKIEVEYHWDV